MAINQVLKVGAEATNMLLSHWSQTPATAAPTAAPTAISVSGGCTQVSRQTSPQRVDCVGEFSSHVKETVNDEYVLRGTKLITCELSVCRGRETSHDYDS